MQGTCRKTSTSVSLTTLKSLTVLIPTNSGKFFKRWEYQSTLPASCETYMQVKKQQLKPDMEQQTGSELGKEYIKAVYCHLAYLNYMQSSVPLLSHVQLFATPWTAAYQASLSSTNSQSLLKLIHQVGDAIQPSHPLSSPSPPAFNVYQHQGLFQ